MPTTGDNGKKTGCVNQEGLCTGDLDRGGNG